VALKQRVYRHVVNGADCALPDHRISHIHTFLWGYLQEYMYINNPHSLDEIKRNIEGCVLNVMTQTVHNVGSNMKQKVDARIVVYGGHFQSLS